MEAYIEGRTYIICDDCHEHIPERGFMSADGSYHFCEECAVSGLEEFRVCQSCGEAITEGMTDDGGDFCTCESQSGECFKSRMDALYGAGKWRESAEEGPEGGCYEALNEAGQWFDTGIYYTTFEEEA